MRKGKVMAVLWVAAGACSIGGNAAAQDASRPLSPPAASFPAEGSDKPPVAQAPSAAQTGPPGVPAPPGGVAPGADSATAPATSAVPPQTSATAPATSAVPPQTLATASTSDVAEAPHPLYPSAEPTDDARSRPSVIRTTPFLDATVGGIAMQNRFRYFGLIGAQVGAYVFGRFYVAGHAAVFAGRANDNAYSITGLADGFTGQEERESPIVLYGASVGYGLGSGAFALTPSAVFYRTDLPAYGTGLALALPFVWVTRIGLRIGFDFTGGIAFGGTVRANCDGAGPISTPPTAPGLAPTLPCDLGEIRDFARPNGGLFHSALQIGWGADRRPSGDQTPQ